MVLLLILASLAFQASFFAGVVMVMVVVVMVVVVMVVALMLGLCLFPLKTAYNVLCIYL